MSLEDRPMALVATLRTPMAVGSGPVVPPGVQTTPLTMLVQCRSIPGWIIPTSGARALLLRPNLLLRTMNPCIDLVWEMPLPVPLTHRRINVWIVLPAVTLSTGVLTLRPREVSYDWATLVLSLTSVVTNGCLLLTMMVRVMTGYAPTILLTGVGSTPPLLVATTTLPPWFATNMNF